MDKTKKNVSCHRNPKCIDHGFGPKHHDKPIQFKRGTAQAFWINNPVLLSGQPAFETDTKKLKIGDGIHRYMELPYIGDGKDGKSAYELWIEEGHEGTVDDFLNFCIGPDGKSAYEIWLSLGHEGSVTDFIQSLQGKDGEDGKSAYEIWIDAGHSGSIIDFLDSLKGESAYEIWLDLGNQGTEQDFIDSLKGEEGKSAFEVWREVIGDPSLTPQDFIDYLSAESWAGIEDE